MRPLICYDYLSVLDLYCCSPLSCFNGRNFLGGYFSLSSIAFRKFGRKIEEEEAWKFMIQMMFALAYLHEKKILHRDVKSQNIFLSKGRCQLGDFGLAKKLEESFDLARTPIGTPFYM